MKCRATTSEGLPCMKEAKPDTGYCKYHKTRGHTTQEDTTMTDLERRVLSIIEAEGGRVAGSFLSGLRYGREYEAAADRLVKAGKLTRTWNSRGNSSLEIIHDFFGGAL